MGKREDSIDAEVEPRISRVTEQYFKKSLARFSEAISQAPWAKDIQFTETVQHNISVVEDAQERIYARHAKRRGISLEAYKKLLQQHIEEIVSRSQFFKRIDVNGLEDVLNGSGRFKPKSETGGESSSKGKPGPTFHRRLFGYQEDIDSARLPHYGYLSSDLNGVLNSDPEAMSGYGKITIRFKRQQVIERTTITFGDSWNSYFSGNDRFLVPTPASHPHFTSANAGPASDPKQSGISDRDPLDLPDSAHPPTDKIASGSRVHYYEAQYHGGVGRDDIESIHIQQKDWDNDHHLQAVVKKFQTDNPRSNIKIVIF